MPCKCRYYMEDYNFCMYYNTYIEDPMNPPCEQEAREGNGGGGGRAGLVGLLLVLLLVCGYLYFQTQSLKAENSKLRQELNQARRAYKELLLRYSEVCDKYNALMASYVKLKSTVQSVKAENDKLKKELSRSRRAYQVLLGKYNELSKKHDKLVREYNALVSNYKELEAAAQNLVEANQRLERKIRDLQSRFSSKYDHTRLHEFVKPSQVFTLVRSIVKSRDWWREVYRLYDYVTRHVRYKKDPKTPAISLYYGYTAGYRYLADVALTFVREYHKYPLETLREGGDCEDQAILLCSMIEAYERYYLGTDYATFIVVVRFSDGSGHATVLIPVAGGEMTILDPAGHYATNCYLLGLCSRPIYEEWRRYQRYWGRAIVRVYLLYPRYRGFGSVNEFLRWLASP